MKSIKIISYSLLMGLAIGTAVPAVQAAPEQKTQSKTSLKAKVKKVVSSKWFKLGVGAAALCAAGAGIFYGRIYSQNQNLKAFNLANEFALSLGDQFRNNSLFGKFCVKPNSGALTLKERPGERFSSKTYSYGSEREGTGETLCMTILFARRATLQIKIRYETVDAVRSAEAAIRESVGREAFISSSSVVSS